jgi:sulfhydrogenase subunit beta (sulfur reductase)
MKQLAPDELAGFFSSVAENFELRLPVLLPDATRTLGSLDDGPLALFGGALPGKPTAAFFPHHGPVVTICGDTVHVPQEPTRPLFVAGFTARDLDCLRFIDRFFGEGWRDDIYFQQRQGAVVAGVSGYCGVGGALLPMAGGDCDLEMAWDGECWLLLPYSEAGMAIVAGLPDCDSPESLEMLRKASQALPDEHGDLIRRASALLRRDLVPDSFWADIGDRCIACTACNLACPTCTCFGVQDWRSAELVERSRMWDSCQLDGFMREASGHNPLGSEALRTRRRIHHKLAADPERWGEISCFRCGRCDTVCPTGIGIFAVAREMVARFGGEQEAGDDGGAGGGE